MDIHDELPIAEPEAEKTTSASVQTDHVIYPKVFTATLLLNLNAFQPRFQWPSGRS